MLKVNIADMKARLSRYLKRVEKGETIVIARRNQPIAELRPVRAASHQPRPIGLCRGKFQVPSDFDEPLPTEILDAFEGR